MNICLFLFFQYSVWLGVWLNIILWVFVTVCVCVCLCFPCDKVYITSSKTVLLNNWMILRENITDISKLKDDVLLLEVANIGSFAINLLKMLMQLLPRMPGQIFVNYMSLAQDILHTSTKITPRLGQFSELFWSRHDELASFIEQVLCDLSWSSHTPLSISLG